jgi:hypothetical protein
MPDVRIAFAHGDPQPEFRHTDVDGDQLFVTTAHIPGQGPGIYFRTDPTGSSIPVDGLDDLITQLRVIADAAKDDADA